MHIMSFEKLPSVFGRHIISIYFWTLIEKRRDLFTP
jgi:hypothetical protein